MTLREKGMKIWETLRPEQKKKAMIAGIVAAIILCALIFYKTTHEQGIDQSKKTPEKKREIALDKGTLEKSLYNESTKQMGDMQSEVKDLQEQLKKVIADKESNGSDQNDAKADLSRTWAKQSQALADKKKIPEDKKDLGFPRSLHPRTVLLFRSLRVFPRRLQSPLPRHQANLRFTVTFNLCRNLLTTNPTSRRRLKKKT